jgi:hypothetical protein
MSNEVLDTKLIGRVSDHLYKGVTLSQTYLSKFACVKVNNEQI